MQGVQASRGSRGRQMPADKGHLGSDIVKLLRERCPESNQQSLEPLVAEILKRSDAYCVVRERSSSPRPTSSVEEGWATGSNIPPPPPPPFGSAPPPPPPPPPAPFSGTKGHETLSLAEQIAANKLKKGEEVSNAELNQGGNPKSALLAEIQAGKKLKKVEVASKAPPSAATSAGDIAAQIAAGVKLKRRPSREEKLEERVVTSPTPLFPTLKKTGLLPGTEKPIPKPRPRPKLPEQKESDA